MGWSKFHRFEPQYTVTHLIVRPGHNFIIKDLPSVLILIIADQILNDSLCCSNKYS